MSIPANNTINFLKDLPNSTTIQEVINILNTAPKLIVEQSNNSLLNRYKNLNIYLNSNLNKKKLIEQLNNHHRNKKFNTVRNQVINSIRIDASSKKTKKRRIKKKETKRRKKPRKKKN